LPVPGIDKYIKEQAKGLIWCKKAMNVNIDIEQYMPLIGLVS